MSLLSVANLSAFYGPSQALFDVSFSVAKGEAVALLGRNGMGKTTTVKSICRMIPSSGNLEFEGAHISGLPSHRVGALGIGLVPEGRRCFASLSVQENLVAAARKGAWDLAKVNALFPRLAERQSQIAASLSGGEQQMLAIGRALMTNPKLLVLDEATEGLAPVVRQEIWDVIKRLKAETGLSILIIDKSLKELRQVCDRASVIERGKTVWDGEIADLDEKTVQKFVGV